MGKIKGYINNVGPVRFFVFTAAIFGLLFIIFTPPFQAPDEPVHFFRAYQVSEFNFVVDQKGQAAGGYLPKAVGDTVTLTATKPIIKFMANKKYDDHKTFKAFSIKTDNNQKEFYDFSATAWYSPVSYIPQATGILLSRAMRAPPIAAMYLGRLGNLVAWIIMFALAIGLMPRKKWALVFIGLLPMALFQAGSLSSDVMMDGLLVLFFSYILYLAAQKKHIGTKQLLFLLVTAAGMVLTKQVMFVFLPLVLLLPTQLFGSKKRARLAAGALIVIPLVIFAGWMVTVHGINITSSAPVGQNTSLQRRFVLRNPYSYVNVLWNTNFFNWSDSITGSFIGNFGWEDTPLAEWIVVLGYLGIAFLYLANHSPPRQWLSRNQKILIAAIGFVYWLVVSTALYVYYTPVGFKIIVGLQGRYFLPLAMLAIPLVYSGWLRSTQAAYKRAAVYMPIFLLVASWLTIYYRYYINNV